MAIRSVAQVILGCLLLRAADSQEPQAGGLRLVGSADLQGKLLRLTPAKRHMAGAAWFERKLTVSGGFESSFEFQLTEQGGLGPGADGFAFVLQNSGPDALGNRGSAGGFALGEVQRYGQAQGIPRSIAIFFDTYRNQRFGDPSGNYIAICTAGKPRQMRWPPLRLAYTRKLPVNLKDGQVHETQIAYKPPILTVVLDGHVVLTSPVDLSTVIDADGAAYAGFTASIGNGLENHDILSCGLPAEPKPVHPGAGAGRRIRACNLPRGSARQSGLGGGHSESVRTSGDHQKCTRHGVLESGCARRSRLQRSSRQCDGSGRADSTDEQRTDRVFRGRPHGQFQG